jgi:hypothetical protein
MSSLSTNTLPSKTKIKVMIFRNSCSCWGQERRNLEKIQVYNFLKGNSCCQIVVLRLLRFYFLISVNDIWNCIRFVTLTIFTYFILCVLVKKPKFWGKFAKYNLLQVAVIFRYVPSLVVNRTSSSVVSAFSTVMKLFRLD